MLLVAGGMFAMFFFASIYVQEVLGYSALRAGLAFLPVTLGIIAGAGLSQQLIRRVGVRAVGLSGMSIAAVGLVVLSRIPVAGTYLGDLLPGLMIMSVGMGLTFVPITLIATTNVGAEDAGLASGLLNTAQQLGGAIGLAVLSTLAANTTAHTLASLGHAPTPADGVSALVSGFHVAFLVGAFLMLSGAVILATTIRRRDVARIDAANEDALPELEVLEFSPVETGCTAAIESMCARRTKFPDMSSDTVGHDGTHAHGVPPQSTARRAGERGSETGRHRAGSDRSGDCADQSSAVAESHPRDRDRESTARADDRNRIKPRLRDRRRGREPAPRLSRAAPDPGHRVGREGPRRGHGGALAPSARHPQPILRTGGRLAPRSAGGSVQVMARTPVSAHSSGPSAVMNTRLVAMSEPANGDR